MSDTHQKFLLYVPSDAKILDAGCGVGRDAKAFQDLGHEVAAFDASIGMVKQSPIVLAHPAVQSGFCDMDFSEEFDCVWASASLLHVPYRDTRSILGEIHQAPAARRDLLCFV